MKQKLIKWLLRLLSKRIYATKCIQVEIPYNAKINSVSVSDLWVPGNKAYHYSVSVHTIGENGITECKFYSYKKHDDAMQDYLFAKGLMSWS